MQKNSQQATTPAVFELRSASYTLPTLRLFDADIELIGQQLQEKVEQAPLFFVNSPLVLDFVPLADDVSVDFAALKTIITDAGMHVAGIRGGSAALHKQAAEQGLALLALGAASKSDKIAEQDKIAVVVTDTDDDLATPQVEATDSAVNDDSSSVEASSETISVAAETITRPIRSGQRRHKRNGDLIVLAQVSEGAEVMADGNIHIYGTLRGRALAGVHGDTSARIYCNNLQAELVAIAGHYRVSEDIDDAFRNQPVQIYLSDQSLIIEKL